MRQRTSRRQTSVPAQAPARTPSPHPVPALQRSAGNHAVNALIARLDDEPDLEPEAEAPGSLAALGGPAPSPEVNLDEDLLGGELSRVRQQVLEHLAPEDGDLERLRRLHRA